jgi:hypothetical protein
MNVLDLTKFCCFTIALIINGWRSSVLEDYCANGIILWWGWTIYLLIGSSRAVEPHTQTSKVRPVRFKGIMEELWRNWFLWKDSYESCLEQGNRSSETEENFPTAVDFTGTKTSTPIPVFGGSSRQRANQREKHLFRRPSSPCVGPRMK